LRGTGRDDAFTRDNPRAPAGAASRQARSVIVQLNTRTKAFCGCANAYGAAPNEHTCPVCLCLI
jgi:hypothetical protein